MATIDGTAILGFRGVCLVQAMACYLNTNGKMRLTRGATPGRMREIATEFTGKVYPRSRRGLELAFADMRALAEGKTLAELGDVHVVNATVSGVAADLTCPDCGGATTATGACSIPCGC